MVVAGCGLAAAGREAVRAGVLAGWPGREGCRGGLPGWCRAGRGLDALTAIMYVSLC
jgi:hypothetical protein